MVIIFDAVIAATLCYLQPWRQGEVPLEDLLPALDASSECGAAVGIGIIVDPRMPEQTRPSGVWQASRPRRPAP
jgi:hypothetical protein